MDATTRTRLLAVLTSRIESIADTWYRAVAGTANMPLAGEEVRRRLSELTEKAILSMLAEPFDHSLARNIGSDLAQLHYLQSEAIGSSVGVLAGELGRGLEGEDVILLQPLLAFLLQDVTAGFCERSCALALEERELRLAYDQLEEHVAERTRELAATNAALTSEMAVRRRAETALGKSEELFRNLVESVSDIIYTADAQGRLTYVSPAIERSLGYLPDEVVGDTFIEYVHEADRSRVEESLGLLLQGQPLQSEYRIVTGSGEFRWMSTSSEAIRHDGQVVGFRGVLADITKRKKAEEALRESETRWRSLVEYAPDLVLTVDRSGRILFINQMFDLYGRTPDEVIGEQAANFAMPEHREAVAGIIEKVFETGQSTSFEAPTKAIDGRILWFHTRVGPLLRGGEVSAVMLITRDVTEQKQMGEFRDNLVRDVSHELRTPLAKMQMSLELLLEMLEKPMVDREKAIRLGVRAFGNVERLLGTVEAILDLSSLEAGVQPFTMAQVDLNDLIEESAQDMEVLAEAHGLALALKMPSALPVILGDSAKLYRVLINLIDNAIKFTDEGEIVIAAESRDGQIEISVSDPGRGISPEHLGRVFERFYQERPGAHGIGVGLTICEAIIEAHGGRIWGESGGSGMGSTFFVVLPVADPEGG